MLFYTLTAAAAVRNVSIRFNINKPFIPITLVLCKPDSVREVPRGQKNTPTKSAGVLLFYLLKLASTFSASVIMNISIAENLVNLDSLASLVLAMLFS